MGEGFADRQRGHRQRTLSLEETGGVDTREQVELGIAAEASQFVRATVEAGGTLLFCGTGGSAAAAQHLAAEYVVRLVRDRRALPAIALTTDTSVLTACANDLGYDHVFARQVEALGRPGDLLVLLSTSGESENLIRAAGAASRAGLSTVALLARGGGRLRSLVDVSVVVPTGRISRAQEIHLAIGHIVCDYVEKSAMEEQG